MRSATCSTAKPKFGVSFFNPYSLMPKVNGGARTRFESPVPFKGQLNQFSLARWLWRHFVGLTGRVPRDRETLSEDRVNCWLHALDLEV